MRTLKGAALSPIYCGLAYARKAPGMEFRARAAGLALRLLRRRATSPKTLYRLLFLPLDSVRYFEFEFFWRATADLMPQSYLDVSSPRLYPLLMLTSGRAHAATLLNPDTADLAETARLVDGLGLGAACVLKSELIGDAGLRPASFDLITCMSVVEHIIDDKEAIQKMWALLRPRGRLCISVPVAAEPVEQFRDFDEYRLLPHEDDGTVFFQRFYDEKALDERIFAITGQPKSSALYGERVRGSIQKNADAKLTDPRYPFWREPYMMARDYTTFEHVRELPGQGVIGLEFVKA